MAGTGFFNFILCRINSVIKFCIRHFLISYSLRPNEHSTHTQTHTLCTKYSGEFVFHCWLHVLNFHVCISFFLFVPLCGNQEMSNYFAFVWIANETKWKVRDKHFLVVERRHRHRRHCHSTCTAMLQMIYK